jgi:hypothetical protein
VQALFQGTWACLCIYEKSWLTTVIDRSDQREECYNAAKLSVKDEIIMIRRDGGRCREKSCHEYLRKCMILFT